MTLSLQNIINDKELVSIIYHDIFEYPLDLADLIKWQVGTKLKNLKLKIKSYDYRDGYFFLKGKEGLVLKRLLRKRISSQKLETAQKASKMLAFIPLIKLVAISGALAMENAEEESDIDFLIVTKKGLLWTTRLISLLWLKIVGIKVRQYGKKTQKNKLCLNMWFDETDLVWPKKDRNIYTAHEIAQIVPLINKDDIYKKFIAKNNWIKNFWPNAIKVFGPECKVHDSSYLSTKYYILCTIIFEPIAKKLQYLYMKNKKTREVITKTRAIFHPIDWGKIVLSKLVSN